MSTYWIGSLKSYWLGLDEAPSGTREDYRGALGDINGDSPFIQPPLKVVEYDCRYLKSSVGLRDVAMMVLWPA